MSKLSVIIPSRNEQFLPITIDDIFKHATGEFEVIATLDGYWPDPVIEDRPNLKLVHHAKARGMRGSINSAAAVATGDYLLKCDAHCTFAEGFDEVLKADCEDNWIIIPRRYSLDPDKWEPRFERTPIDYEYLSFPWDYEGYGKGHDPGLHGTVWRQRAKERRDVMIDENMSFQGSCWFMLRNHFWNNLGGMQEEGYETFIQEPQEIGLKTWLGGGKIMTNKNTYYAHLHKGKRFGRGYFMDKREVRRGAAYSNDLWMFDRWDDRVYDLEWLIDRFWPVPLWPDNWKEIRDEHA